MDRYLDGQPAFTRPQVKGSGARLNCQRVHVPHLVTGKKPCDHMSQVYTDCVDQRSGSICSINVDTMDSRGFNIDARQPRTVLSDAKRAYAYDAVCERENTPLRINTPIYLIQPTRSMPCGPLTPQRFLQHREQTIILYQFRLQPQ